MTGLGHFPGGSLPSRARDMTPDGTVIVGESLSLFVGQGDEAMRWEAGTMTGLGDLPGGNYQSRAFGVSPDGRVVVGKSHTDTVDGDQVWAQSLYLGLHERNAGTEGGHAR